MDRQIELTSRARQIEMTDLGHTHTDPGICGSHVKDFITVSYAI